MTEALSLFGLWALGGVVILGIIPWLFKLILKHYFLTKYMIYFNQRMVYDAITRKLDSGLTLTDIINNTQQEIQNGKS